MYESSDDPLVEIPDDDLHILSTIYHSQELHKWGAYMYNHLKSIIRWKRIEKYKDFFLVLSPINEDKTNLLWEIDGTVVIVMKKYHYDVVIFTFNEDLTILELALVNTNKIEWNRQTILFYAVNGKHMHALRNVLDQKGLESSEDIYLIFTRNTSEAKSVTIEIPDNLALVKVSANHVRTINDHWKYKFEDSENYVRMVLEFNKGHVVIRIPDYTMLAWTMTQVLKFIGTAEEVSEDNREIYIRLLVNFESQRSAKFGYQPFYAVPESDIQLTNILDDLQYTNVGKCSFVRVANAVENKS